MKAGTNSLIKQINGKFFHIKFFYSGLVLKANGLKPREASFNVIPSARRGIYAFNFESAKNKWKPSLLRC